MNDAARRLGQIRGLALAICGLTLVVVMVSAYLRLQAAGLGCADWPACYGGLLTGEPAPLQYGFARLLHRVTASLALVLALILVWRCWRPQPLSALRPALILLSLMLGLSVLGFFSADPRRALVGFLNIVGGFALVTFSWRVALASGVAGPAPGTASTPLLRVGLLATSIAVAVGAWIGATYAAAACPSLPFCSATKAWGPGDLVAAFNPFLHLTSAPLPGDGAAVAMHALHRGFALLALLSIGILAVRMRRPAAWVALVGLVVTFALGGLSVAGGLPLWAVVAHGAAATVMLAALATLLRR